MMMMTLLKHWRLAVAALMSCMAALTLAPAHASLADLSPATLSNVSDMVAAAGDTVQGNVTCRADVYGGALVQHTNVVAGDVFAQDFAVGQGLCNSLTLEQFSATLYVDIEYYDAAYRKWRAVGGTIKSRQASSRAGVLELPPLTSIAKYSTFPNTYLDRYHRGHVQINTSFGKVFHNYTPAIWFMAP